MSLDTVTDAALASAVLDVVARVVGPAHRPIPLHAPKFSDLERQRVLACIDSEFVSSIGPEVDEFEARLREFTGAKHAIAIVNGTAALQVALSMAGVGAGDEVLVPALSFVATANAVCHCGAAPHFVDSESGRLGMDPQALDAYLKTIVEFSQGSPRNRQTGARLAAVVPMHAFGHPVDLAPLLDVAGRYRIPVVEDAAESLGSTYHGRHTGTFGLLASLSFNGNKLVTTGGGGAVLTNDAALAKQAKHLTTTAKRPHRWEFVHDAVAWNFRMPNLNAALGCAQMERLPGFLAQKRWLASHYQEGFAGSAVLELVTEPKDSVSNYWLNTVRLTTAGLTARDTILDVTNTAGYQCRPVWTLLHRLPMFASLPRAPLPVATVLEDTLVNMPSSPHLAPEVTPSK